MYRGILLAIGLVASGVSLADDFQVSSQITLKDELLGTPTLLVNQAEAEYVILGDLYRFSVNVTQHNEAQVLVDFSLSGKGYDTQSQVLIDLDKAVVLDFDDQQFRFLINKVSG
ncbi:MULTISPECIES: hypothetical protein [Shewanella]|uniref:DUF2057 domain-containing protein n=1 Tax=Shewanella marisflavi TaxID=260364 RepID=A0ABX5WKI8_9GAMM|nr:MULTISPECIES: hypothetical protein [Shewanella]QDF73741.1 hypothetical protein FGA12_00325 [Shewanella marisflavi]